MTEDKRYAILDLEKGLLLLTYRMENHDVAKVYSVAVRLGDIYLERDKCRLSFITASYEPSGHAGMSIWRLLASRALIGLQQAGSYRFCRCCRGIKPGIQDFPVKRKEDFFIEQIKYYYSEQSAGNSRRTV